MNNPNISQLLRQKDDFDWINCLGFNLGNSGRKLGYFLLLHLNLKTRLHNDENVKPGHLVSKEFFHAHTPG